MSNRRRERPSRRGGVPRCCSYDLGVATSRCDQDCHSQETPGGAGTATVLTTRRCCGQHTIEEAEVLGVGFCPPAHSNGHLPEDRDGARRLSVFKRWTKCLPCRAAPCWRPRIRMRWSPPAHRMQQATNATSVTLRSTTRSGSARGRETASLAMTGSASRCIRHRWTTSGQNAISAFCPHGYKAAVADAVV